MGALGRMGQSTASKWRYLCYTQPFTAARPKGRTTPTSWRMTTSPFTCAPGEAKCHATAKA